MTPIIISALIAALFGSGGVLAFVKFFRTEAPQGDASTANTLADAKLKEAQATQTIAEAFTSTLGQVRQLAEDRAKENAALKSDLSTAEGRIDDLEERVEAIEHFYSPRGAHGSWDEATQREVRKDNPEWPEWPSYLEEKKPR